MKLAGRKEGEYNIAHEEKAVLDFMRLNIGIDGPVGAGKSSVADAVAERLGILHLDTGAMYRALGLKAIQEGIDLQDEKEITGLCRRLDLKVAHGEKGQKTFLDGKDVSSLIRSPEVSMAASTVSRYADVRKMMVQKQQKLASEQDMLLDGRDICTTVLPLAPVKIYLTASAEERARRRFLELQAKCAEETYEEVLKQVNERDYQDMHRPVEPLRQAEDAVLVDSTEMSFDQVVERILAVVEEKRHGC